MQTNKKIDAIRRKKEEIILLEKQLQLDLYEEFCECFKHFDRNFVSSEVLFGAMIMIKDELDSPHPDQALIDKASTFGRQFLKKAKPKASPKKRNLSSKNAA